MPFKNAIKTIRNILSGKYLATASQYYDPRYSPIKFLVPNKQKIHIQCILCGFPRSGTNWLRNVLEKSTGQKVANLGARKPTTDDKNVLCIKIHARSRAIARIKALWLLPRHTFGGKYVYMYRDPRDAIISLYQMYKHRKNCRKLTPEEFLKSYDPIGQYQWEINAWVLGKRQDTLLIRFEDLKSHPMEGFRRIFDYLGVAEEVNKEVIEQRINLVNSRETRERAVAYGWKNASAEYAGMIQLVSKKLDREIRALGYEQVG